MERWRDLFVAEYPRLAGWTRRLVGDDETAQEIAAEAFTRLMARLYKARQRLRMLLETRP